MQICREGRWWRFLPPSYRRGGRGSYSASCRRRVAPSRPQQVSMFYASWVKQTWTIQMWPGTIPFTVSRTPNPLAPHRLYYACGVNGFNIPVKPIYFVLQLPSEFRKPVEDRLNFMPVRN